ncbi:hypothetical protein RHSIM_Rhsim10G0186300 [Rhododendron simsii]|uniref:Uncharacterized protein n=1 Tax=Rhododendron simsii TaxID=118357 RepID=A0A834GEF8_RHOSS|nr:hypothetical protein RHSIM_Rhsim10G0186300 [Rhododendron simsii]
MASASVQAPRLASSKTEPYVDNKRKEDLRHANIGAALAVANAIRTSLGRKGMDKMISTASGKVIITNVGGGDLHSSK